MGIWRVTAPKRLYCSDFLLTRWRACCQTSTQILQPVQTASAHVSSKPALLLLLTLSLFYSPSHFLKVICHLLRNQQILLLCIKKVKNGSLQRQTNQPAPNHQQGHGIHHHFWNQILPLLQWPDFWSWIWIQTRSLYPGHAASAFLTMDGGTNAKHVIRAISLDISLDLKSVV